MDEICIISKKLESKCGLAKIGLRSADGKNINDLIVAKTRGAPKACKVVYKKWHCSTCNITRHTKRNCPTV